MGPTNKNDKQSPDETDGTGSNSKKSTSHKEANRAKLNSETNKNGYKQKKYQDTKQEDEKLTDTDLSTWFDKSQDNFDTEAKLQNLSQKRNETHNPNLSNKIDKQVEISHQEDKNKSNLHTSNEEKSTKQPIQLDDLNSLYSTEEQRESSNLTLKDTQDGISTPKTNASSDDYNKVIQTMSKSTKKQNSSYDDKRNDKITTENEVLSDSKRLIKIRFKGDDLAIIGNLPDVLTNYHIMNIDDQINRMLPRDYFPLVKTLQSNNINYETSISHDLDIPNEINIHHDYTLYDFQKEAVMAWFDNDKAGTIILPTGSGKSIVALDIIRKLKVRTLIVVPTLVLFEQWKERIEEFIGLASEYIGYWGGGDQQLRPITIITYDSAHLYSKKLRDEFNLLILDEAHHLTGANYSTIVNAYIAEFRLALSATLTEDDKAYETLMESGFSPIVYQLSPTDLQEDGAISNYEIRTIKVEMDQPEEYKKEIKILQNYIRSRNLRGNVFQQIIFRINKDPEAERAMRSYNKAKKLAFAAANKINILTELLKKHEDEKILLFSDMVDFCEEISRKFLIPTITHRTSAHERKFIMEKFNQIDNAKLISSTILDEGVDIADASIGIIVAGSGHPRQFIQRLGRILRKHPEKEMAILYEIVSKDSMEIRSSKRRKKTI